MFHYAVPYLSLLWLTKSSNLIPHLSTVNLYIVVSHFNGLALPFPSALLPSMFGPNTYLTDIHSSFYHQVTWLIHILAIIDWHFCSSIIKMCLFTVSSSVLSAFKCDTVRAKLISIKFLQLTPFENRSFTHSSSSVLSLGLDFTKSCLTSPSLAWFVYFPIYHPVRIFVARIAFSVILKGHSVVLASSFYDSNL